MPLNPRIVAYQSEMVRWRHDIHAHPELLYQEHRTAAKVVQLLEEFGCDSVTTGIGGTGVVATVAGRGGTGRAIGLRADMDALPIQEANDFAHASRHPGKMHACGHDGHTTMLLGAARYLAETRNFAGTVNLIFQPAEEGGAGAKKMIEDGLFTRFPTDEVYAIHNWPELPPGEIAVRAGPMMAATDQFTILVEGFGAHAAMPHLGIDSVVVAAHIVTALQTLVSRATDPADAAVVSVTMIHAGTANNVIPPNAKLDGTVRTFSPGVRNRMEADMGRVAQNVAAAFGARANLEYRRGYPVTANSAHEADRVALAAAAVVGESQVHRQFNPSMAAEDFGYMLEERPGAYIWLGQGGAPLGCALHNPRYDFNDEMLAVGASLWAALVEQQLPLTPGADSRE